MKDELMRRISTALDAEGGLASDPALQAELRTDPVASKYAKDVARVGKWLATWPLPEPDDAAFEALASRIEQRLGDSLPTASDPTALPVFDDDDALRDATAGLLQSGEMTIRDSQVELLAPVSDPNIPLLSDPSIALVSDPDIAIPAGLAPEPAKPLASAPPPPAPSAAAPAALAKVSLGKSRPGSIVEEASGGSGEPRSAADLELALKSGGAKPKKKKKKQPGERSSLPPSSSDRISIPTPKPVLGAPTLSPVASLPKEEERKGGGAMWWLAAAAAIGLGVFGATTLFESEAAPTASRTQGSTLVTSGTLAPTASARTPAPSTPAAAPVPEYPPPMSVAAATPVAPPVAAPLEEQAVETARPSDAAEHADWMAAQATSDGMRGGLAGARPTRTADPFADDAVAPARHRALGGPTTTPTTTSTTAPAPPPPPATMASTRSTSGDTHASVGSGSGSTPSPAPVEQEEAEADRGPLPETPDRSTIQAVLAARTDAVTACAAGAHGLADVDIVIASSGRITTATVNGSFAGTPVGSCIARAVRAATFPPFSQPRFEVTYPYHL